jgi:hypothetical protein
MRLFVNRRTGDARIRTHSCREHDRNHRWTGLRWWLHLGLRLLTFNLEVHWWGPNRWFSLGLLETDNGQVGGHLALGPFWFSLHVESWPLFGKWPCRATGISAHDGALWLQLAYRTDAWEKPRGGWRQRLRWRWRQGLSWRLDPLNLLCGKAQYRPGTPELHQATLPLPEGNYKVNVELRTDSWRRPRAPWTSRLRRAHMTLPTPIPIPGKGENSWDCGEDSICSLTCPAPDVCTAVTELFTSVLRRRYRHGTRSGGGTDWRPRADPVTLAALNRTLHRFGGSEVPAPAMGGAPTISPETLDKISRVELTTTPTAASPAGPELGAPPGEEPV